MIKCNIILAFLLSSLPFISVTSQITLGWEKAIGGSEDDSPSSITPTIDGGFIVVGSTKSTDGEAQGQNQGASDVWILKIDNNGNVLWETSFGSDRDDWASGVLQTKSGDLFIVGTALGNVESVDSLYAGDIWVLRLNSRGEQIWTKSYGSDKVDFAIEIIEDKHSELVILGDSFGSNNNLMLFKIDTLGNEIWSRIYDSDRQMSAASIVENSRGGYAVVGVATGSYDCFVMEVTENGELIWEQIIAGSQSDHFYSIVNTPDGGYIIGGSTSSTDGDFSSFNSRGPFLMKLNKDGEIKWINKTDNSEMNQSTHLSIVPHSDGSFVAIGTKRSIVDSIFAEADLWILQFDTLGNTLYEETFGGSESERGFDINRYSESEFILIGITESPEISGYKGRADYYVLNVSVETKEEHKDTLCNKNIAFYPNPISNFTKPELLLDDCIIPVNFEIYDSRGRLIERNNFYELLDFNVLISGLYFLRIIDSNEEEYLIKFLVLT